MQYVLVEIAKKDITTINCIKQKYRVIGSEFKTEVWPACNPRFRCICWTSFNGDAGVSIGLPIDTAAHGAELIVGAVLAIRRHHQLGGIPARAIWCDDHRSADGGRAAALHLTSLGVRYVIGHFSSRAAVAAAPVYAANHVLFIAPGSSAPELTATHSQTVLRMFGRDDDQAEAIVEALIAIAPFAVVEILAEDNAYGRGVSDLIAMQLARESIASNISVIRDDDAWSSISDGPVVMAGRHEFSARLLCQMSPARVRIATDDALTPAFLHAAGSAAEGALIPMIGPSAPPDETERLHDRYIQLCKTPPGGYFLTSYVAVDLILNALRNIGDCGGGDMAAYLRTRRWPTVLGDLSVARSGEVEGLAWRLVRVTKGRFVRA